MYKKLVGEKDANFRAQPCQLREVAELRRDGAIKLIRSEE